jgi:hypothetical protein
MLLLSSNRPRYALLKCWSKGILLLMRNIYYFHLMFYTEVIFKTIALNVVM